MPASVEYVVPVDPAHADDAPVIVGVGSAFIVMVIAVLVLLLHPDVVFLASA